MNDIEKKECAIEMIRLAKYSSVPMIEILKFIYDAKLLNDNDYNREIRKLKLNKIHYVR